MKIARVRNGREELFVIPDPKDEDRVRVVSGALFDNDFVVTDRYIDLDRIRFLPPVMPSKIVAAGLNYRDHAQEMGMEVPDEPCIFLKPPSSVIAHKEAIVCPSWIGRVDYEAELALVIKKTARSVAEKDADSYILGYTCLNDVTARDLQHKDAQWTRAKAFDTFCPLGPWMTTRPPRKNLAIRLYLNDTIRQESNTGQFIFGPARILSFVSSVMTLLPGDVISTGTPAGIGPMQPGDTVRVEIEGVGTLENKVEKDPLR